MSMERIDFSSFNKPKHFPSWLCDGDTLKLAEYDDAQLEELDSNIREMSEQFDIDNASGAELDRIGKLLGEDRGGNSDDVYRQYIKLRTMLNTANGTIEDIIKFVKFFYSSETVHLVPNYPAGLRILHDGFNDTLDFNRIIKQIVGAGISYDTRELFNMSDEFPFSDKSETRVHRVEKDSFARNAVLRNGRVLRDGVTVLPTQYEPFYRDGSFIRDGSMTERGGRVQVDADGDITVPVMRSSGLLDLLSLFYSRFFEDEWKSRLLRNGAVIRDGSERRSSFAGSPISDTFSFGGVRQTFLDEVALSDEDAETVVFDFEDGIGRGYRRDGSLSRDGETFRASECISDPFGMASREAAVSEEWSAAVKRIGLIYRDGSERRSGFSAFGSILDTMTVGVCHRYFRDGSFARDGGINRDGDVVIVV